MKVRERKARTKLTYDYAFQERIVRTLYQDPDWCMQFGVPYLNASLFDNNVHAWAAGLILSYAKKFMGGITRDAIKIEAKHAYNAGRLVRRRDKAVVNSFVAKCRKPVKDRSYIKRELYRFIKTQTLKDVLLNEATELVKHNQVDLYDASLQRVLDVQPPTEGDLGHFMAAERGKRYARRRDWTPDGIATGLEVDQYIKAGGPKKKQLAAIVAPPHTGKTTMLCHLAKQAVMLAHKRVLFISLEEDDLTIQDRLDAAFTGININELETKKNCRKVRRYWRRFQKRFDHEMLVVKEFPMGVTKISQIERYIKSLERKGFYPDVVFIDYAGLLKPDGDPEDARRSRSNDSRYEEIGSVCVELRSMAQRLKMLVWTAFQGNRQSMGKKIVTMKDLAESFKPAMDSDILIAICQTEQERLRERARLYSMKVRGGRAYMDFNVKMDYERVRCTNRSN
jgi:replicative DNA helicase